MRTRHKWVVIRTVTETREYDREVWAPTEAEALAKAKADDLWKEMSVETDERFDVAPTI